MKAGLKPALRWRLRRWLGAFPARPPAAPSAPPRRIAYLFAGTFGDFVQMLPALRRLAAAYPQAQILLAGEIDHAREFQGELPANLRVIPDWVPWTWVLRRVDLLFTNAVGVYRVRFEAWARLGARRAFGFRHVQEHRRGAYGESLPLDAGVKSFAAENLKLLDLAGVPAWAAVSGTDAVAPWGRGIILFHIGSAGLKKDFGLKAYTRIVLAILSRLKDRPVEVVMGPGDEDIALEVRSGSGQMPQMYPLASAIRRLRAFEGTVICFNSFLAHLCHYLGRPALVIHRGAVPYGYDCAPLHRQIVLSEDKNWDLGEVWEAVEHSGVRDIPK